VRTFFTVTAIVLFGGCLGALSGIDEVTTLAFGGTSAFVGIFCYFWGMSVGQRRPPSAT
jgi:hypothetical protein